MFKDIQLSEHSRKNGESSEDDDTNEARDPRGHRLNHVYQGSLRETGSTSQTPSDTEDSSAATTTAERFHIHVLGVLLVTCYKLTLYYT